MKNNLQLAILAFALSFATVKAQNDRVAGTTSPLETQSDNGHSHDQSETPVRRCATEKPSAEWDAWFNTKVEEFKKDQATSKVHMPNYTIPVVVHVIHSGEAVGSGRNISAAQVQDQINILNADYAGTGLNNGLCPAAFTTAKANSQVSFCLATKTPSGTTMAEPGIDRRIYSSISGLAAPGSGYTQTTIDGTIKPNTIWDPTRYCNMWVCQLGGGLLGYATFPAGTGLAGVTTSTGSATTDGVVIGYNYFGSIGAATAAPYNKGRTATHEVGHWLGLRHITGDANCGNDFCTDTPPQEALHFGCISSATPYHVNQCGAGTSPNGEMTMNFMDYTDDACMYMFTNDQKTRIQTAMANGTYRSQLTTSAGTLCTISAAAPVASISIASTACAGNPVSTSNNSTGSPIPTYVWSSNPATGVTFNPNNTSTNPSITFANAGTYTISCAATNSLGTNSNSKVITINTCTSSCNDTLGTTFAFNNGQNGNMFDLTNSSTGPIQILSFEQVFQAAGTNNMSIYYKTGTYVGSEAIAGNWTLAGSTPVTAATGSVPVAIPITLTVSIPAGGTMGFYVTGDGAVTVGYTNGTNQGGIFSQENGLQFREGKGVVYPFAGTFGTSPASRIWNGVIHYCNPLVTGINGMVINESDNSVFPNPNSGNVTVNVSPAVSLKSASVKVFDMFGRLVYTQSNINTNNFTVNHNLASGLYTLQVENNNMVVLNKKISVQ